MRRLFLFLVASGALGACGGDHDAPCDDGAPGTVCAVAGTGALGFNRDGLSPEATDLYLVSQARRGPDGRVYLMDFNNHRLRVITDDGTVATVAGDGFHAIPVAGEPALEQPLENPIDFDFLPNGEIVFVSYHDPRVLRIDAAGRIQVVAGTGAEGSVGNEGDGGPALDAAFRQLAGIAVAPDGAIYVADTTANRVRVIRDGIVDTAAGDGRDRYAGDGGPALDASLFWPTGLDVDRDGRLLIADNLNNAVRRLEADGTITTVAGTGVPGLSGDGGPAHAARVAGPDGVAVADDGTIYIADRSNFRIRRVAPDGIIDTFAGTRRGFSGDDGPATEARFGFLARLSLDETGGELFLADQSNSCARKILLGP